MQSSAKGEDLRRNRACCVIPKNRFA